MGPSRMAKQFGLLLWKNYVLQKRKILVTLLEIGLPTLLCLVLIFIRRIVVSKPVDGITDWRPFKVHHLPNTMCGLICQPVELYYTPDNPLTKTLMTRVKDRLGTKNISDIIPFDNETSMVSELMHNMKTDEVLSNDANIMGGIVFDIPSFANESSILTSVSYTIRLPSSYNSQGGFKLLGGKSKWNTEFQWPMFQRVGPREGGDTWGGAPGYMSHGFLSLQLAVDLAIIEETANISTGEIARHFDFHLKRNPYPKYNDDPFVLVLQNQLPVIFILSFVFIALNVVKDVVHEKERKLKESMKMMGLSNWLHWTAWFLKYFIFLFIAVAIMTLFLCIPTGKYGSVIGYTHPSILFVFLLLYSVSVIMFCFAVSVFFNKANSAAAAGGILFFCSYIPYFFIQPRYYELSWSVKMVLCLIPNVAMSLGGEVIGLFEGTGAGVQWATLNQGVSVDDSFTMLNVMMMLVVDSILAGLLTWYVEAVFPGEFSIPLPWYFPFQRSYWLGSITQEDDEADLDVSGPILGEASYSATIASEFMETEPMGLRPGIQMRNLRKVFGHGDSRKVAVDGTTLNMYEGQITALLGHNGAGKTTTMSMLTGFIPPSSGTAIVNGYDIWRELDGVRSSLGLCPQHDILFDNLTVGEHLDFFGSLKGCCPDEVQAEGEKLLAALGMTAKLNALAKTLSGGMKRKLSVIIALIGKPRVVILDEPTSGMDPDARRQVWDVLHNYREGRALLLSTHFMDEADILGDRIAIMAEGVIQCCGSSLFLKKKYGAGYHMVMVKQPGCDISIITDLVKTYIPSAELESNVGAELSYILPHEESHHFEELFDEIEQNKEGLGVASYGASVTTMEEVFLRVGDYADPSLKEKLDIEENLQDEGFDDASSQSTQHVVHTGFGANVRKNMGSFLYIQQYYGMFIKRILHTWRNRLVSISQLIVPLFFTVMGLTALKSYPGPQDSPSLKLDIADFDYSRIAYSIGTNYSNLELKIARHYKGLFDPSFADTIFVNNVSRFTDDPKLNDYFIYEGAKSLATYTSTYLIGAEFDHHRHTNKTNMTGFFNDQAFHTPAMTLNALTNVLFKMYNPNAGTISTYNHPLPRTTNEEINDDLTGDFKGFTVSFNAMFGMSFLVSSFTLFLIRERSIKAKHCQVVSGVHSVTFWVSTLTWDMINYIVPVCCLLLTFVGFGVSEYYEDGKVLYIILLFVLYGWAVLPFMYVLSFIFSVPSTGLVWLTFFNILSGVATVLSVVILSIPQLKSVATGDALKWLFYAIFPNFCLGQALEDFYLNSVLVKLCDQEMIQDLCKFLPPGQNFTCCKDQCGDECIDWQTNVASWEGLGIGRALSFLAIQGFVYLTFLFVKETEIHRTLWYHLCSRSRPVRSRSVSIASLDSPIHIGEDSDVAEERRNLVWGNQEILQANHSVLIKELTKEYGQFLAVDRLSVGIPKGECFGLLGLNGAGKTTTFKMLTGDESITHGNAFLDGFSIKKDIKSVQRRLGYCPQHDALIDQLTGRETLRMYSRLRGIPEHSIEGVVDEVIHLLLLRPHADRLVKSYSGGNKRKLSTAIALIGDPPVIFLDEPTTGMDPVARRHLWNTLSKIRANGTTLILTSHSMEECEALCTRIAIMVNGQFKCLGSPQHLKDKFGEGYTLLARVGYPMDGRPPNLQKLLDFINNTFPESEIKDIHQNMVHVHIRRTNMTWGNLFGTMERAKSALGIEDYSVSQTTLEQVFINFARSQIPPREDFQSCSRKLCKWCKACCCCCCNRYNSEMQVLVDNEEGPEY